MSKPSVKKTPKTIPKTSPPLQPPTAPPSPPKPASPITALAQSERVQYTTKKRLEAEVKQLQDRQRKVLEGLPHLYEKKFYPWMRKFFDSTNRLVFLTAANQSAKSSTQIRRMIHWATEPKLWPKLWPKSPTPRIFWYLYPTKDVLNVEIEKKWIPEFLPRGEFKDHYQYGWELENKGKDYIALHFKSGVSIYFKTYGQDTSTLQTGTVHALAFDEELPIEHYSELIARTFATDGYFSGVFTPTLNQEFWYQVMECKGSNEKLPQALKINVSLYDCLKYEDGSPSTVWTEKRIKEVEASCKSRSEVMRRVYGRFVTEEGRKYPTYDPQRHIIPARPVNPDWKLIGACDIGSGGLNNHPAAIVFLAVAPDFSKGYIYDGWRGDGIETTAADVLEKFKKMRGNRVLMSQVYDGAAKDFGTIANRLAEPFTPADKKHQTGEDMLNSLFQNNMIQIFDTPELSKLGAELTSLMHETHKSHAKDDFIDAFRYALMAIPWDFSQCAVGLEHKEEEFGQKRVVWTLDELKEMNEKDRRGTLTKESAEGWADYDQDIDFWNEQSGT